jgi:predicted secreted Zn-dependent protease
VIHRAIQIEEVKPRAQCELTSIEERSQRIVHLLDERRQEFDRWVDAIANGEAIPPRSSERFKELTRAIEREYVG